MEGGGRGWHLQLCFSADFTELIHNSTVCLDCGIYVVFHGGHSSSPSI